MTQKRTALLDDLEKLSLLLPFAPRVQAYLLKAACACILAGILVAGLWPFHAPRNQVTWLSGRSGLSFGKYGSILSDGGLVTVGRSPEKASLEVWLEPSRLDYAGTILAWYSPITRATGFSLRQSLGDLKLESPTENRSAKGNALFVDVFRSLKPVFVTVSSGRASTSVYVNGVLVRRSSSVRLSAADLTGRLVLGNAPSTADSWSGQVLGLAVYDRELSPIEVSQHYADGRPGELTSKSEGLVARYRFDEGKGNIVHSDIQLAPNLSIPEHFFVLNEQFLERPWDEFVPGWNYCEDLAVNVAGFVPLGLFFCAYFSGRWEVRRACWITIVLGFAVSFTIEVLQSFLPTRNSGMTDLFSNTLGTALGAVWCAASIKRG